MVMILDILYTFKKIVITKKSFTDLMGKEDLVVKRVYGMDKKSSFVRGPLSKTI